MSDIKDFKIENGVLTNYIGNDSNVTIPDSVTSIGSYAFYDCSNLQSITIPDSVTSIGESAFRGCSNLQNITIPDSVTSIGERAFWDCSNLQSITIPDSVTTIGSQAFQGCSNLQSITIPDSVTSISYKAFKECKSLKSISIPDSVTSIDDRAFENCSNLQSITIPDSVTSISKNAFEGIMDQLELRKCVLLPTSDNEEFNKIILQIFGTKNLALPFLLGTLQTNDSLEKKIRSRVTNKKFREKYIPELIEQNESSAIHKMLSLVKKMLPEELDIYIEKHGKG